MCDILVNILMNLIQWPIIACLAALLYLNNLLMAYQLVMQIQTIQVFLISVC